LVGAVKNQQAGSPASNVAADNEQVMDGVYGKRAGAELRVGTF
jgi:hypothetical protein